MTNFELVALQFELWLYTGLPITALAIGGFLYMHLKLKKGNKETLRTWRENLTYGDKVAVNDGAVKFNAQITQVWEDRVQVISKDMRVAAYPKEVIYPIE
jgi:preprotein translocase subunit YajC